MEILFAIIGAIIAIMILGRFSNDAAREQNRRNLEEIGGQS